MKRFLVLVLWSLFFPRCAALQKVVLDYQKIDFPPQQIRENIAYEKSPPADTQKNKLDLFLPKQKNWPVLVFVHGGQWSTGDKDLKVIGADIYQNIGRCFANLGIGVAVIDYQLMPEVNWKTQTTDVAQAIQWVRRHIHRYGGDPQRLFVMGHSAGAQLAARVAFDPTILNRLGSSPAIIRGLALVSGAGYDLTDEDAYELAQKMHVFEKLFHSGSIPYAMRKRLSPMKYISSKAPPTLILYSQNEKRPLRRQSVKLHQKISQSGVKNDIIEIPHKEHKNIVLTLSDPHHESVRWIYKFITSL